MNSIKERAYSPQMKHHMNGHGKAVLVGWPPQNREQRRLVEQERKRAARKARRKARRNDDD